jgi:hypothetical protein
MQLTPKTKCVRDSNWNEFNFWVCGRCALSGMTLGRTLPRIVQRAQATQTESGLNSPDAIAVCPTKLTKRLNLSNLTKLNEG